jgi:hypothetical protein
MVQSWEAVMNSPKATIVAKVLSSREQVSSTLIPTRHRMLAQPSFSVSKRQSAASKHAHISLFICNETTESRSSPQRRTMPAHQPPTPPPMASALSPPLPEAPTAMAAAAAAAAVAAATITGAAAASMGCRRGPTHRSCQPARRTAPCGAR